MTEFQTGSALEPPGLSIQGGSREPDRQVQGAVAMCTHVPAFSGALLKTGSTGQDQSHL